MAIDFEPDSFFFINEQGGSNSTGSELKFIYSKCPTKTIKKKSSNSSFQHFDQPFLLEWLEMTWLIKSYWAKDVQHFDLLTCLMMAFDPIWI